MDKTNKAIAIGVAVGIVVAVLLVAVIIPEIRQARLRHQEEQRAELLVEGFDNPTTVSCHSNMLSLASGQAMHIGQYGRPASSFSELMNSEIYSSDSREISCLATDEDYVITVEDNGEYTITCPHGHGSITGGGSLVGYIRSWE